MSDELTLRETRLRKLGRMRELGHDPFRPEMYLTPESVETLLESFVEGREVSLAGRVVSYRLMGKAGFAHISDGDTKIQAYFRKDELGDELWEIFTLLDIGDQLGVEGKLFITKTGEKSIHAATLAPLSKSLQSIPIGKEKEGQIFSGLSDVEMRYRHRHLDLIANPEARKALIARSKMVSAVRHYFEKLGYLEVETPMLQLEAGGAAARPFLTHYNAYEIDVKLRISLELYLKRLICGDLRKVFEIGRVFRNEGVSNRHSPEFTMLEFYEAFANYEVMMERVEGVFKAVAEDVFGSAEVTFQDGEVLDFGKPWRRVDLLDEIENLTGLTRNELSSLETAKAALGLREIINPVNGKRINAEEEHNLGGLIEKLLEVFIEPTLLEPSFVVGYPVETSPLAKRNPHNPRLTQRFEGYIRGKEICNAFSELNDPIDQRERFLEQLQEREKGDDEAHPMDEEFLFAVECGMPPTGGCGIGIDRLVMMLTGAEHIREIILFPFMRPLKEDHDEGRIP